MADPTLFLLDGTAQLFRAYFALPGLTNAEGLPTNAVFGFTTMLRKLLKDHRPEHLCVAFDVKGPTFRTKEFADYKANRPPTPEDLNVQAPYARKICEVLGIAYAELEGYEADDLIATYARLGREAGYEVVIVGSDKDLLQLVGEGVRMFNPAKERWLDAAAVRAEYGVGPEKMLDVQALMGDSVDNIPGVPGVGEKGALNVIATYGSLDEAILRSGRFAAVYDARDAALAAMETLAGQTEIAVDAIEGVTRELDRWTRSATEFVSREQDPQAADRVRAAMAAADAVDTGELRQLAGQGGKKATRLLRDLKKQFKAMDKGSAKRLWYAINEHTDQARLSRRLATLDDSSPVPRPVADLAIDRVDTHAAHEFYQAMGFTTLVAELEPAVDGDEASAPRADAGDFRIVLDADGLGEVSSACADAERIAWMPVLTGGDPQRSALAGLALAWGDGTAAYIPTGHFYMGAPAQLTATRVKEAFASWLGASSPAKVAHDVKSAIHGLASAALLPAEWEMDTMVAAFLLNPGRSSYDLEVLAGEFLGKAPGERPWDGKTSVAELEVERVGGYAARVADAVLALAPRFRERLEGFRLLDLYREVDGPLLPLLARMESAGIGIDVPLLEKMSAELGEQLDRLRAEIHRAAGVEFNIDSPKQLREVLFERLELKPRRKTQKSKVASTGAETLEELTGEHAIAGMILEYRELAKLKGTYVDALPRLVHPQTGRVHTCYHPTGAATGRLSSSDPNLQNIPIRTETGRRIRAAFVASPGNRFLASDYSQIELRVLAHLTEDEELIAAFLAGEDIHRYTAARVFGVAKDLVTDPMRRRAKAVNFGILYGMSETRLAREQGMKRTDARRFIQAYFERFSRVRGYIDDVRERALREGAVRTLFGRVRYFPQLHQRVNRAVQEQAYRAAVNTTIQGTAADLMKMAMLKVDEELRRAGTTTRILLQVHDELLLEVPERELGDVRAIVRTAMEEIHPLRVPLLVDQSEGENWYEAK